MSLLRTFIIGLFLVVTLVASASAQVSTPIRLIVPYPPGGSVDTLARLLQGPLQEQLKSTVIVENRPGAGGRIAASQVKRERADGSAVLIAPNALTTFQSLVYAAQIDYSITEDFIPVSRLVAFPLAIAVSANSPIRSVADLTAAVKEKRAVAHFGTSGAGGMAHFSGLMFAKATGVQWTHVPYKGGAPLVQDLIGGHVPVGIDTVIDQIEHHSNQRFALAPDIPTLAEQGVSGLPSIEGWFGAFVPAKTPGDVVARLDQAFGRVLADPQLKAKLNNIVIDVSYLPSAEFTKLQAAELQQWAPVVRDSGFKPE
jgi:tripartite-type tricarboxylate transporter receptor subunit TctC